MERIQKQAILRDLDKKMVFIVGPRQVGKTWLARNIAQGFKDAVYLNYDQTKDKAIIIDQSWLDTTELLIFDELHKMPDWKNYIKGVYDTKTQKQKIIVTGSARLDVYDQLGDSLAGRYFRHRLLPLSAAELIQAGEPFDLMRLLTRGGFPEPYFTELLIDAQRWRMQYKNSLLSTDIFDFEKIQNIKAIQLIFELLRQRVGSPVSYQSLAEDVNVSAATVKHYIQILEALYVIFRITPFSKNIARSLLKEPKLYFFDIGMVSGDDGCKLENLIAISLLKHVYGRVDYQAQDCQLHYLRTKDRREVDFAITLNQQVEQIIEVKLSDTKIAPALQYFHQHYEYPAVQVVQSLRQEYRAGGISVISAQNFLSSLYI